VAIDKLDVSKDRITAETLGKDHFLGHALRWMCGEHQRQQEPSFPERMEEAKKRMETFRACSFHGIAVPKDFLRARIVGSGGERDLEQIQVARQRDS
jgi:hypothetical protein